MSALRVMFVVPHPIEGPSTRFRIAQFLPYLAEHGVEAELRPFFTSEEAPVIYSEGALAQKALLTAKAALRRLGDAMRAGRFDLVYVLREAFPFGPELIERMMAARAGRMAFDFDDAIYMPSRAYDNPLDRLRDFSKPGRLMARADHVIVGSPYLAEKARGFGASSARVTVIPTVVDTARFRPDPQRRDPERLTIGWIGTPRGASYLHALRPVFELLCEEMPQARFVFVGAEPFDVGSARAEFRQWRLETELAEMQSFDIGLMPLPDDEEARGKCAFKLIEYMAVGAVGVASPVGANLDVVEHGRTGLFAQDAESWAEALRMLGRDAARRADIALAARKRVEERFSLAFAAPRLLEVLRAAAQPGRAG